MTSRSTEIKHIDRCFRVDRCFRSLFLLVSREMLKFAI